MFKKNHGAESGYFNDPSADGNFRHCKLVLAAWIADYPEWSDLYHPVRHDCFWCECPKNKIEDYVTPGKQQPRWDHKLYRMFCDANIKAANAEVFSISKM